MGYKLFDANGCDVTHHDLQDKGVWCKSGASKEEVFVEKFGAGLSLIINPEKTTSPYVPDLWNVATKNVADLKTQNTPFFQAKRRFGLDPQNTVVFNGKDRLRYRELYPQIEIYFAVDWQVTKFQAGNVIEVKPMTGVWFIPFARLDNILDKVPFHAYRQRQTDTCGNAKGSYVLNLMGKDFVRLI